MPKLLSMLEEDFNEGTYRTFKEVKIDDTVTVMVGASILHYCRPTSIVGIEHYSHVEMTIIGDINHEDIPELNDYWSPHKMTGHTNEVTYIYVPVDLVEAVYKRLKQGRYEIGNREKPYYLDRVTGLPVDLN